MAKEEVTTSVRNPVLKRKFKAQRGKVFFHKPVSPVGSGLARGRATDPASDADDPIIEATGISDSRKRAKSLAGVVTPEKLKEKRGQSSSKPKQRPTKKVKPNAEAGDVRERRSSRGSSKRKHRRSGAMEILSTDKVHMCIRGSNTEIDVILTSPVKRVLNTRSTNPSTSDSEDARDTEASVRSRGEECRRSNRKVVLKSKSSRKLVLLPSVETVVQDRDVAATATGENGGEQSHKHGQGDDADRPQEKISTNDFNPNVETEVDTVPHQCESVVMRSIELGVEEGGAGPSDRRSVILISGEATRSKSPRRDLVKAQPAVVQEEERRKLQVDVASPNLNISLVQEQNEGDTAEEMYEPAAAEPRSNTSNIQVAKTAGPLSQVKPTVETALPTLGLDGSGSGGSEGRTTVGDGRMGSLLQPWQPERSITLPSNQTKAVKFGSNVVLAIPAPAFRSPPPHTHGKDCTCSKGGRFKYPGGTASSALTNVTTPQLMRIGTPSSTFAGTSGATKHTGTPAAGRSNPPVGCSPPPTALAKMGSAGAVRSEEALRCVAPLRTLGPTASSVAAVVTTPGTTSTVVQATVQTPSFRTQPSNTHGKDCPENSGGKFKNPGGSASATVTTVSTPQVQKNGTPSSAVTSTSGATRPPRTPTAGGCNPPVPCSPPPTSLAETRSAAVGGSNPGVGCPAAQTSLATNGTAAAGGSNAQVGCSAPLNTSATIGSAGAEGCQDALRSVEPMRTSAPTASSLPAAVTTPDTRACATNLLSTELSVKQQLKAMLERMTPGDRVTWLRESAEELMQRNGLVEGGGGKSGKKDKVQKEGGSSRKSPSTDITRKVARREASELDKKQKEKDKQRKKIEEDRRKAVEESERQKKLQEVDRHMRELQNYKSKLMGTEKGKGAKVVMSPRESQWRTPSTIQGGVKDLQNLKQVSALSKKKVTSTPPAVSSDASGSTNCSDPLLLGVWEAPKDIPSIEMNSLCRPTGRYWEHLSNFAFKRATMTFPNWDISWPRQNSVRKVLFVERLKELYPGGWDTVWVMQKVGGNIRQRRVRMRNNFKRFNRKENAPVPPGLALDSWNAIYDQLSNPKYQEKADKCKMAAEERSRKKAFSHKLGPKGVAGLITKFGDEFDREPTEEEIFFGKENGVAGLIQYTHDRLKMQNSTPVGALTKKGGKKTKGKGSTSKGRGHSSTQQKMVKHQSKNDKETTSEESARTSSSNDEEDDNNDNGNFAGGSADSGESSGESSDEDEDGEEGDESDSQEEEDNQNDNELEEESGGRSGSEDDGNESNSAAASDSETS